MAGRALDGGRAAVLNKRTSDSSKKSQIRSWMDAEVEVSPNAGRRIEVPVETTPRPAGNGTAAWAVLSDSSILGVDQTLLAPLTG